MKATTKVLTAGMGSALVVAAGVQGVALASVSPTDTVPITPAVAEDAQIEVASAVLVECDEVVGTFSFTQAEAATNAWLAKHIGGAPRYLCGSEAVPVGDASDAVAAEDWTLAVSGAVASPYEATIGELAQTEEVQSVLMGCSCAGNPVDGLSSANALVEGISVLTLISIAGPDAAANTIVFTSADGYEVALPLDYIESHYCPLVFNANGSALVESVGGTNQLWLGSTPASYFARDVVSIRLEVRDTPPASPASDEGRAQLGNLPNVGVLFGGEVA